MYHSSVFETSTFFGTWRSFDFYAVHPMVVTENETELNGNFNIILTLHSSEVSNSQGEEFSYEYPS